MPPPISSADLTTLTFEADRAARRLCRKLALPAADIDDLRQDLLIDLICRLPGFDPHRGSIGAFAGIILRNQCARIAMRQHRQRRAQGGAVLSLDAPAAGGTEPLGHVLTEGDGLAAWHGQDCSVTDDAEARHDLARALADLPEDMLRLCSALGTCAAADLARREGISRSALYRRIARLRLELAMRGFAGRWDRSQTA